MNKKIKRWRLNVLESMDVTAAVTHFEISALNAEAPLKAVGVYVNAVDVGRNKENKKGSIRESQSHGLNQ